MGKLLSQVLAMAAMMAASAASAGEIVYDDPRYAVPAYRAKQIRNCEKKKCKSCAHYHKPQNKYSIYHCETGKYVSSPMQVACDFYKKRKR